jgi:hypothetical protein
VARRTSSADIRRIASRASARHGAAIFSASGGATRPDSHRLRIPR